jgi:hypothetical protein
MRAALLFVLSLATYAAAFFMRQAFVGDVAPISWGHDSPQNGALELAYLLLSIENMAAIVAAIALVLAFALSVQHLRQNLQPRMVVMLPRRLRQG